MIDVLAPAIEVFLVIFYYLPYPIYALFQLVFLFMFVFFVLELLHKWGA